MDEWVKDAGGCSRCCFSQNKREQEEEERRRKAAGLCCESALTSITTGIINTTEQLHEGGGRGGGGGERLTFWELHLPSSKMSPRMNTISGLSNHSAVWKALSICHSLCVQTQRVSAICGGHVLFTPALWLQPAVAYSRSESRAGDGDGCMDDS